MGSRISFRFLVYAMHTVPMFVFTKKNLIPLPGVGITGYRPTDFHFETGKPQIAFKHLPKPNECAWCL